MQVLNFQIIANTYLIGDVDNDSRKRELEAPRSCMIAL